MANCVCCGRKIKFSEMSYTLDSLYWGEACPECHKKWLDHRYLAAAKILEKSPREVRLILEENGFSVLEANQAKFEEVLDGFRDIAPKIMISEEAKLEKENADAEKRKIIEDNKRQEQERLEEYKKALERLIITTSFNVEGYRITKYIDVISGASVMGTGALSEFSASLSDLLGTESNAFAEKLNMARASALLELKKNGLELKADGIINIAFSYVTFANNMIGVIANGTAVKLEEMS